MKLWPFSKRNMAIADAYLAKVGQPSWTSWTVQKAVKEGYKKSGWVYVAVRMIGSAISSVPWVVYNEDGEQVPDHPLSILMTNPNPRISRQTLFELLSSWLQLTGNAYLIPVKVGGKVTELWPVSPDRLTPVSSDDPVEWVKGYALDQGQKIKYKAEEVIHFLFPDPANPIVGIGPLEAASKAIDLDIEQQDWIKSALQNGAVLDGVFSFKRDFKTLEELATLTDKLNEKFTGKKGKRIGAVGSEATYTRMAMNPDEMNSIDTRKFTREEIFIIFGIPPQLAGAQENSTYNNYQASELIFWAGTISNNLNDLKDTLNFYFKDELQEGLYLGYDLSNIPAIRRAQQDRIKSGKTLVEMGVPVERVNAILELNIEKYDGWDRSFKAVTTTVTGQVVDDKVDEGDSVRTYQLKPVMEQRSAESQGEARENEAIDKATVYEKLLNEQKVAIFAALDNDTDPQVVIDTQSDEWVKAIEEHYTTTGFKWASATVVESRAFEDEIGEAIAKFLEGESIALEELSHINRTTADAIILQVEDGIAQGLPMTEVQQSLVDMGVFSPERALMISRTITGAGASLGQLTAGQMSGATTKTWENSGFEVRKAHVERDGETVGINDRFSIKLKSLKGPRFPGDPNISAADRINCRCSLTFT